MRTQQSHDGGLLVRRHQAGGIAVAAMPLLRAKELSTIADIAQISHALCDEALRAEVEGAQQKSATLKTLRFFNGRADVANATNAADALEPLMAQASGQFQTVDTAATDTCLLGFTSGTTGVPKATMHFHRDVMAVCACWPPCAARRCRRCVHRQPAGGLTFGLGGRCCFPCP